MKIAHIYASNVKRLRSADITLEGNSFIVAGRNRQGKSSLIDAIKYALVGSKAIPEKVITDGQTKTEIYIDLTKEFRIEKVITEDKTQLIVRPLDDEFGKAKYSSPQDMLDKIYGQFTFDPLEFQHLKTDKQIEILTRFLPEGNELRKIDQTYELKYSHRTEVNKDYKKNKLNFESMAKPKVNLPDSEVSIAQLVEEKEELQKLHNQYLLKESEQLRLRDLLEKIETKIINNNHLLDSYSSAVNILESLPTNLQSVKEVMNTIHSLKMQRDTWSINLTELTNTKDKSTAELLKWSQKELKDLSVEIAEKKQAIDNADELNRDIRYRNDYAKAENQMGDAKIEYDRLTDELKELEEKRFKIFESAKMPVEGLTFNKEGIFLNNIPFSNLSDSEKVLVSMKIGMALNPKLRVMFSKYGNDFDDEWIKILFNMADTNDYQLIVEKINPVEGLPYVIIEDGVVSVPLSPQNKETEI